MTLIYTPYDYNQNNVLKVPFFLILACLFSLKHFFLIALPALNNISYLAAFARHHTHWSLLLTCIPALLVLPAMGQRMPKGRPWARRIWRHGRALLLIGFSTDLVLLAALTTAGLLKMGEYTLAIGSIDFMFLFYVWHSQRVRDVFSEFPHAEDTHGR